MHYMCCSTHNNGADGCFPSIDEHIQTQSAFNRVFEVSKPKLLSSLQPV